MPSGKYTRSEETRKRISLGRKGKGIGNKNSLGFKHSLETRKKISLKKIGNRNACGKMSQEHKNKISAALKGKTKKATQLKEKHWNWKGGITPEQKRIRVSKEYKLWRKSVFERDNYTCIWCFKKGVELNADHIKPFAYYPELRFAIDNGRTLCVDCHKTTDTYKARAKKYGVIPGDSSNKKDNADAEKTALHPGGDISQQDSVSPPILDTLSAK